MTLTINISNGSRSLTSDTPTLCPPSVHVTSRTFQNLPGLPAFHTASDKSLGRPGYEAKNLDQKEVF